MGPKPKTGSIFLVKARIALATMGVSLAALCLLGFIWIQDRSTRLATAHQTSLEIAHTAAGHAAHTFESVGITLGLFARHLEHLLANNGQFEAESTLFLRAAEALPDLAAVTVIDANGDTVISVGAYPAETQPATIAEYLRSHQETGSTSLFLVRFAPDHGSGSMMISITRRFDDPAGELGGLVVARLRADFFKEFYGVTRSAGSFGAALLTEESRIVTSSGNFLDSHDNIPGERISFSQPPSGDRALPSIAVGDPQVIGGYVGAAVPVVGWPLTALVAYSPGAILKASMGVRFGLSAAAIIIVLAGFFAFLILSRNYGKQCQAILQLRENRQELAHQVSELEDSKRRMEKQGDQLKQMADELIIAKQSAEQGNRAKSNFLAQMSHELRTPLNAILGFSEVIRDQVFGANCPERYVDYANDIHSSGHHLLDIINDILDLSKIEAGKMELNEQSVDVAEVIEEVRRILAPRADDSGLELVTELPDALPDLKADRRSVKQMLINLIGNAIKYTPEGGKVTVSVAIEDGACRFSVADTGIGISQEDLAKVLSPFGQVSAVDRSKGGTGLGVPIVSAMARLHGGSLQIESEPGVGSTFIVTLPKERIISLVSAA